MTITLHQDPDGFERVTCSTEKIELTVIPELGAKVISLLDKRHDREWIASPQAAYRSVGLGGAFEESDRSGWDECFPNVAPGPYPRGKAAGLTLVDHGEVWSRPWRLSVADDSLTTSIDGELLPFELARTLRLEDAHVDITYSLINNDDEPLCCLWSMHPLFATRRGTQILLPGVATVYCDDAPDTWRFGGYLEPVTWPVSSALEEGEQDLSVVGERSRFAIKLFAEVSERGEAALVDAETETWIALQFDKASCPYIGLWINEGGWPSGDGLQHVALEPTSGRADKLAVATEVGETWLLDPGCRKEWTVRLSFGQGRSALADTLGMRAESKVS